MKTKPLKANGKHQCRLLDFAFKYPGWHSINRRCQATKRAVRALEEKGYLIVSGDQFKLTLR